MTHAAAGRLSCALLGAALLGAPASPLLAQVGHQNRVFLDALGSGIVWSLSYERLVTQHVGLRVGAGGLPASGLKYVIGYGMPVAYLGGSSHRAVIGVGGGVLWAADVWVFEDLDVTKAYGTALVGYEFQPRPSGIVFRAAFTPLLAEETVSPWGGVSIGWAW